MARAEICDFLTWLVRILSVVATAFWGHFQASSSFRSGDKDREGRPDVDLIDVGSNTAQGILKISKHSSKPLSAIGGGRLFGYSGTHCQRQHRDAVHKQVAQDH